MNKEKLFIAIKWFGLFYGIVFLRNVLESYLEKPHKLMSFFNLFFHYPAWFGALYLSAAIVVAFIARDNALKLLKKVIVFSPAILIVPVLDFIESGGQGYALRYLFGGVEYLLKNYFAIGGFLESNATIGQLSLGFLALTAALFYVYEHTDSIKRVFLAGIVFYSIVFFYASFPSYFLLFGFGKKFSLTLTPYALFLLGLVQLYFLVGKKRAKAFLFNSSII